MAFTSNEDDAGSDGKFYVDLQTRKGQTGKARLYNRPGNDYSKNKGDLWAFDLQSDFGFSDCFCYERDVSNITLTPGGTDGWNIQTIFTILKIGNEYTVLSADVNVNKWLDGDRTADDLYFKLSMTN